MKYRTVLHITPHFGGGVGKVLIGYLGKTTNDFRHKVVSLEYANELAVLASKRIGFPLSDRMSSDINGIISAVAEADIVLVHWWNHPLLNAFLVRENLPPARIIFWSHISGFAAPYVFTQAALDYPDIFVFTTPVSFETAEIQTAGDNLRSKIKVIWSTGGIEEVVGVQPIKHSGFNIGYIGTVDYSKLHPDFLKFCGMVNIPEARFIVCGGPSEDRLKKESGRLGLSRRFDFKGKVPDVSQYLSEFDVFGYPLAPYHWGTCEQALCESMAAGVPPVVLANRAESYIVENGVSGIVAANAQEYAYGIERLYHDSALREKLSLNTREIAKKRFSIDRMIEAWEALFKVAMNYPKTPRSWKGKYRGKQASPSDIFLESLGSYADPFFRSRISVTTRDKMDTRKTLIDLFEGSHLWCSETRGTPRHYRSFFPNDDFLNIWSDLACGINEVDDNAL